MKEEAMTGSGSCPFCQSLNVKYSDAELDGEQVSFPFTCEGCGKKGKEWYSLSYIESLIEVEEKEKQNGK